MPETPLRLRCPVCRYGLAQPFFSGGLQPLATLGWPVSAGEAQAMARLPLDFVQCPRCSHVWNRSFDDSAIPYRTQPNRMFNKGSIWQGHLAATRDRLLQKLPPAPVIVDIGCGEGHFLRGLAEASGGRGRFVGFDPSSSPEAGRGVEFHARYFDPLQDLPALQPDAVTIRHVLEHMTDPAGFVEQLAWAARQVGKPVWLLAETPCIDRVFESRRLADFFYEHVSHFSTPSFRCLMAAAGAEPELAHGYDGEVVYALCRLGVPAAWGAQADAAARFHTESRRNAEFIRSQLDELARDGRRVAIWGGTGKAAAFMHQFDADAARFPLVVDSDPDKVGSFVPGTGQCIQAGDRLRSMTVDVLIIPTQWRARDILVEMQAKGIRAGQVLIEHEGRLIDFHQAPHPYR